MKFFIIPVCLVMFQTSAILAKPQLAILDSLLGPGGLLSGNLLGKLGDLLAGDNTGVVGQVLQLLLGSSQGISDEIILQQCGTMLAADSTGVVQQLLQTILGSATGLQASGGLLEQLGALLAADNTGVLGQIITTLLGPQGAPATPVVVKAPHKKNKCSSC